MKFSIAKKVSLLTISMIILFTFLLSFYFLQHEKHALIFELDERATSLLNNLAINTEYPVLIKDYDAIFRLGKGILTQKDIIFCEIVDKNKNILFRNGSKEKKLIREYSSAIVTEKATEVKAVEDLVLGITEKPKEEIGKIHLSASLISFNKKMNDVRKTIIISAVVVIVLAFLFSNLLLKFILKQPIDRLVMGTKRIATGDLNYKVYIKTRDEIGLLADAFNKMSNDLQNTTVSKDYVDNIIKSMIDTLIVINPDATIKTLNQATLNLLGYKEDELIGKPVGILFAAKEEETLFKGTRWEKLLKEGSVRNYEMTYRTKTGEKIPVSFSGSVMYAPVIARSVSDKAIPNGIATSPNEHQGSRNDKPGRKIVGTVGIARDIRDIKHLMETLQVRADELSKAYDELKSIQTQLLQSAKLASIGELAAGFAHEIGNPLQTILGNADLLLMDNKTEELRAIKNATLQAKKVIENILDFSRQKEMKFIFEDVNNLLEKTLSMYGKQLELKKIKVIKNYSELPKINVSPSHLEQMFLNLIINAQKAMQNGGTLTITTRLVNSQQSVVHSQSTSDHLTKGYPTMDYVEISFKDTGVGISKENLSRIFEPFFTTKKDGTGLGLSVSYGIVKQHGGEIFAFSDGEGKGAEFVVKLSTKFSGGGGKN